MNQILNIIADTLKRDGLVRTAQWTYNQPLYNKKVDFKIPNYALPITVSQWINTLDIRLQIDHLLPHHSKLYVQKIFNVDNIILERIRNTQLDLNGQYLNQRFRDFFYNNIMILDFASDSLYYTKNLGKMQNKRLPHEVTSLAKNLVKNHAEMKPEVFSKYRDGKLDDFWDKILQSEKTLNDFESRLHKQGINAYGDIITPFTKQIGTSKDAIADVERINESWMTLNRLEEKPEPAFISLSQSALRNDSVVTAVVDYIKRVNADIIIVKVKNIHLTDGSRHSKPRELFAKILKALSEKKQQNPRLLTICLECGEHLYPLAIQAFDVVSASANMFDMEIESGGSSESGYGKALDEDTVALVDYDDFELAFNRLGHFPCSHEICHNTITTMNKADYPNYRWWTDSRRHNILTMNDWMRMISESVINETADLAVERLRHSPLRILTELLVRNYEDPTEYMQE